MAAGQVRQDRIACVTVVKNAEARISEWIAYHLAIGFGAIIIFDNGSTDDTVNRAARFQNSFDVRIIRWPATSKYWQRMAYEFAVVRFENEFEWCGFIDVDEFISLPKERALRDLVAVADDVSSVLLPWAFFGSSGKISSTGDFVIGAYLYRSDTTFVPNRIVKNIVRMRQVRRIKGPHVFRVRGRYVDMNHNAIDDPNWFIDQDPDYSGGKLNHYFVQSQEDWRDKLARSYPDFKRSEDEFATYDRNEIFDDQALAVLPRLKDIIATTMAAVPTAPDVEFSSASLIERTKLWLRFGPHWAPWARSA